MEYILGGDGLCANSALGKGYVLGDVLGQMVAHHEHVEVLVERVTRERPCWVRRRRQHVLVLNDRDDVWGVAASSTFSVVRVNRPTLERGDGRLDEARLVECISVNETLNIQFIADGKACVDSSGCTTPVLVKLETASACCDLLAEGLGSTVVALARDSNVDGEGITSLEHLAHVVSTGCTSGCIRSRADMSVSP